ncbi:MAG: hypothetical protein A2527_00140 [Candidatus Lambdaproteobacteria bacterium RIFOXYD2_FULL_50_16]|uniref:Membrane protein 6-pyruvoyl-tetrahydropterin synthase-related domain-containing protein n=1 Tax=Candidatus Lambdaproteobacteria bacterium RIFOXYD2_FULL_50_16 TaxID=1817772 RepID=A0A1F6GFN4_9PROT|nr:MAG: hypothetical protein A2527_00140 [Candidatus Lambdaproteobacteria bacterium RIFOXYD2_FULL_50_16]
MAWTGRPVKLGLFLLGLLVVLTPLFFHWQYYLPPKEELRLFRNDTLAYSYWWSYFFAKVSSQGGEPLWNPYASLGYPALAQIANTSFYPIAWPLTWFFEASPVHHLRLFNLYVVFHLSLAAGFTYLFLLGRQLSPLAASLGALTYSLSSAAQNATDGFEWLYGLAWAPLGVHFLLKALESGRAKHWALLSLTQGILYSTNFLPVLYYESLLLGALLFLLAWNRPKTWLYFGLAHLGALLIAAPGLFNLLELVTQYSERTKSLYSFSLSGLKPGIVLDRFFSPMEYQIFQSAWFGFTIYLLLLIPLFLPQARPKWTGGFSKLWLLIFFFGSGPFFVVADLFYLGLPGYSTQHWHHRTALFLGLPLAYFAASGLDYLLNPPQSKRDQRLLSLVFGLLALGSMAALVTKPEIIKRVDLFGYFAVLLGSLLIWLWAQGRGSRIRPWLVILLALELGFVFRQMEPQTTALLKDFVTYGRGAEAIWADQADQIERYFEGPRDRNSLNQGVLFNRPATRSYVTPALLWTDRFHLYGFVDSIAGGKETSRFQSEFADPKRGDLPSYGELVDQTRVFLTYQAKTLPVVDQKTDQVVGLLREMAQTDLRKTVWLPANSSPETTDCAEPGQVKVTRFWNNGLWAEVNTQCPAWLVWVDSYYPGWQAQIDDQPAPLVRADYAFKAVRVESGLHLVKFEFRPPLYDLGRYLRWASLLLIALIFLVSLRLRAP